MADRLVIGCGYLGQRVAARWHEQGQRVWVTTRQASRGEEFRRQGWQAVLCDVLDPVSLAHLPPVETAVYCVGLDRGAGQSMQRVYVDGLANVLAAWKTPPARVIYVSSTGVYGQTEGEEVDETAAIKPTEESGRIVLEAEGVLRSRLPRAIILRFAGIYGPGRLLRAQALRDNEALAGDPEGFLNLIHVTDGAAAVLAAEARGAAGSTYIISDDCPVRRRNFYTHLAQLLGTPPPRFEPWPSDRLLPALLRANRRLSNRRARTDLAWNLLYPSYEQGLLASLS
jgi:nucleoside-diphosphate-sugar epimerase